MHSMSKIIFNLIVFMALVSTHKGNTQAHKKFLALGDSYTIGESVVEPERWPNQLAEKLKLSKPTIIATTGWRTDQLKAAIEAAKLKHEYDLVSLLIGVNNQYQGRPIEIYEQEFEELLQMSIMLAKGKTENVLVVSIPDYGYTPFGKAKQEKISAELNQYNAINKRIADKYGIRYFDITPISRKGLEDAELIAPDGLHPSGKMYAQWVELIYRGLNK
ncbi:MAG: SGNH/GDSL hydrolase family protein [Cyclobacteriaceae bacterium]|nr:SGNH/GDSL hydrolase family protein [Cyclobacteriaceae bacterium]